MCKTGEFLMQASPQPCISLGDFGPSTPPPPRTTARIVLSIKRRREHPLLEEGPNNDGPAGQPAVLCPLPVSPSSKDPAEPQTVALGPPLRKTGCWTNGPSSLCCRRLFTCPKPPPPLCAQSCPPPLPSRPRRPAEPAIGHWPPKRKLIEAFIQVPQGLLARCTWPGSERQRVKSLLVPQKVSG